MEKEISKKNNVGETGGKILSGKVVSVKMKDTVVVSVQSYVKHLKYGKYQKYHKRYKAHDKGNVCTLGDQVLIKETKPISKDKHFIVIERKKIAEAIPEVSVEIPEADSSRLETNS